MKVAALPRDEEMRLAALHSLELLDTDPEEVFDDFTRLAASLCRTPIALIGLIDEQRQWFKSRYGIDVPEIPREHAFCSHAILEDDVLVVPDSARDERFADNPLATGEPHVRFYAGVPLRTDDGQALGTLCVIDREPRDLDEHTLDLLRILARHVVTQIALRRLAGDLSRANEELRRFQQIQDDFVAAISHDLRSPLSSVVGLADFLEAEDDVDPKRRRDLLRRISQSAQHTLRLASNLIDASRFATGAPQPERAATPVGALLEEVGKRLEGVAQLDEVQLQVELPRDLPTLDVDAQMIDRAVMNLVTNAIQYSPRRGVVRLSASADAERVVVRVGDQGPGVPPEERPLLFTRYGRLKSGAAGGAGLGLYIVRRLIEAHGGSVGFESPAGGGSEFFLTLPRG